MVEGPLHHAFSRLDVIAVTYQQSGGDSIGFTATVSNPTNDGMQIPYACVILRGNKDRLVGASCRISDWIGPNGTGEERVVDMRVGLVYGSKP